MARGYHDHCNACGTTFRNPLSEARHRHNFPALCKRNKQFAKFCEEIEQMKRDQDAGAAIVAADVKQSLGDLA